MPKWNKDDDKKLVYACDNKLSALQTISLLDDKFTKSSIYNRIKKLDLSLDKGWSSEEIEILKNAYEYLPIDELEKLLPNRNRKSIIKYANKNGLLTNRIWNNEDKQYLISNFKNKTDLELSVGLNRTEDAIRGLS